MYGGPHPGSANDYWVCHNVFSFILTSSWAIRLDLKYFNKHRKIKHLKTWIILVHESHNQIYVTYLYIIKYRNGKKKQNGHVFMSYQDDMNCGTWLDMEIRPNAHFVFCSNNFHHHGQMSSVKVGRILI